MSSRTCIVFFISMNLILVAIIFILRNYRMHKSWPLFHYSSAVFQPVDKAVFGNLDGRNKFDNDVVIFVIQYLDEPIERLPVIESEVAVELKVLQLGKARIVFYWISHKFSLTRQLISLILRHRRKKNWSIIGRI